LISASRVGSTPTAKKNLAGRYTDALGRATRTRTSSNLNSLWMKNPRASNGDPRFVLTDLDFRASMKSARISTRSTSQSKVLSSTPRNIILQSILALIAMENGISNRNTTITS